MIFELEAQYSKLNRPALNVWGYLKYRVYEGKPRTLQELKEAIRQQVNQIHRNLLERVEVNFCERLQICVNVNGHHMPEIFRTL